jgi:archaellum component FlaC
MTEPLLHEAVQRLEQQVAVLQQAAMRRHRLALTLVQPQPWLGQAVTLVVQVTDEAGTQPRVDLPVLLTATWGRLRVADGYSLREGESVVARTDLQGVVTATLLPPLTEQLGDPEQRALETQLAHLDATASTPERILPALAAFVQQYQQTTEQPLRTAVDFYFQRFYQPQPDALTTVDWLQSWRYRHATVVALASETGATTPSGATPLTPLTATVQGAAMVSLRFTEWLGPWLQAYIDLARADERLRRQFETLKTLTGRPEELVAATSELVQAAVRNRAGRTGEQIEQQVVYGVVTTLLDQNIRELPVATRIKLLTGLPPATGAVRTLGSRAGTELQQSAFDLKQEVTQTVESKVGQLNQVQGVLTNRLAGVEGTVGGLQTAFQGKADRSELATLQGQLTEVGKGTQSLATRLDKLNERTEAFQVQFGKLQTDFGRFDTSLGKFQVDLRDIQEELKRRPGLTVIQELQATLATLANTLTTLNTDVTNFRDQVNLRLSNTVSRDDLTQVRTDLGRVLATKIDQRQLDQSFGDVEVRFKNLQTDFSVFSSQFNRLRGDLDNLGNNVSKLRFDFDKIRPRP